MRTSTRTTTPTRTATIPRTSTPTRTKSSTRTPTLSPTATRTPESGGPVITYFGIATAGGIVRTPARYDELNRPVFTRPLPRNFIIVVEARPGPNKHKVGQSLPESDDGELPDLWIQANRALGNGSATVCDKGPPPDIGGVPGFDPPNFDVGSDSVRAGLIDFACRFGVHIPAETGSASSPGPCTLNSFGNFRFLSPQVTNDMLQFCYEPAVGSETAFPSGPTILTAHVLDDQGVPGDPVQIVIDVAS